MIKCKKVLDKIPHDKHWAVVMAQGIVFAQGECKGYKEKK